MCQGCSVIGRIVLVLVGLITVPLGLAATVAGIMLLSKIEIINFALTFVEQYLNDNGITGCFRFSGFEVSLSELATGVGALALALGLFLFLTGLCGCMGGCCTLQWSLVVYIIIYGLAEIAGIVFIILEYTKQAATSGSCYDFTREQLYSTEFLGTMIGLPVVGALLIFLASWVLAYKCKYGKPNTVHPI